MNNVKYLLYSKQFKRNLVKWLFMYILVVGLLTVVVTYSRYITDNSSKDIARPALFEIKISNGTVCNLKNPQHKTCTLENLRPADYIYYYFDIDTSMVEITSDLTLTYLINDKYDDFGEFFLSDVTDANDPTIIKTGDARTLEKDKHGYSAFSILEPIQANLGGKKSYELKIKYLKNSDDYFNNENIIEGAVTVGYSMIQK